MKAAPDLKHAAGDRTLTRKMPLRLSFVYWWEASVSPGPACVHLDDISVLGFGPQQPGVASILQGAPVVGPAITVEDVVAMETLHAADLVQLVVLRFIREVEGPQCRLLQDNTGTADLRKTVLRNMQQVRRDHHNNNSTQCYSTCSTLEVLVAVSGFRRGDINVYLHKYTVLTWKTTHYNEQNSNNISIFIH